MPFQRKYRYLALAVLGGSLACKVRTAPPAAPPAAAAELLEPDGADPFSVEVRRGRAILNATRDSLPGNVGNALRCTSCHLQDGTREVLGWEGVYARYPQYRSRSATVQTFEDRINDCLERSMAGRVLRADTAPMRAMVAYFAWRSRNAPVTPSVAGPSITRPFEGLTPDTAAGRRLFEVECARCHGPDGEGTVLATPLWGPRSFTIGAGMVRFRTAAAFIHANMPFDRPGTLTPQQAVDVAGFVTSRPRPDFAAKGRDWPQGGAPKDTPYATDAGGRTARH
jgi:thiosulfate dehydrogenase